MNLDCVREYKRKVSEWMEERGSEEGREGESEEGREGGRERNEGR